MVTGLTRNLQGLDGVCSPQTVRDLELAVSTLKHIVSSIQQISPDYAIKLDLASLTTLVVENLFAEMREGNDMPLMLQFAHRLSSSLREHEMWLQLLHKFAGVLQQADWFSSVTKRQLDEMQRWREEFGQSVRQVTVRNKSTKDNPGTLPINCYAAKATDPRPVYFSSLSTTTTTTNVGEPAAHSSPLLFRKDEFVIIKPGFQPPGLPEAPFFLGKCANNVKGSERRITATISMQDQLIPFNFVNLQHRCQIEISGILRQVANIQVDNDTASMEEDKYFSSVID